MKNPGTKGFETELTKVPMVSFLMDREKDRTGNLSADTRRVTTESAPVRDFREAQKEPARLLAGPSFETALPKVGESKIFLKSQSRFERNP